MKTVKDLKIGESGIVKKLYGEEGAKRIIKAFNFASQKHYGQFRDSGEEYISHPIAVAEILVNCKADEETIICFNDGNPACIVKTIDYKVMKFKEMTESSCMKA